jgi:hypothetical protein
LSGCSCDSVVMLGNTQLIQQNIISFKILLDFRILSLLVKHLPRDNLALGIVLGGGCLNMRLVSWFRRVEA